VMWSIYELFDKIGGDPLHGCSALNFKAYSKHRQWRMASLY